MKIKGNGLAISIACLALAVAMSGTAYAVTASTVNIADPTTPSHVAKVDSAGHLQTTGPMSTLATTGNFQNVGTTNLTSATKATLAITEVQVGETRLNGTVNGSDLFVQVVQVAASGGTCGTTVIRTLFVTTLASEQVLDLTPPTPMVVKPSGTSPYCLALASGVDTGGTDDATHFPQFRFTGYVVSGTYTGIGTAASRSKAQVSDRKPNR